MIAKLHRIAVLVLVLLLATAGAARADKLIMKDGTTVEGKILNRNAQLITIEVIENGKAKERIIIMNKVEKVIVGDGEPAPATPDPAKPDMPKPATPVPVKKDGPTYFVIPIRQTFGIEVEASVIEKALEEGAKSQADAIILDIDSPGGLVSEMLEVMDVLSKWQLTQKTPLIAYIQKDALSAAALTAMSVKNIYMSPNSTMGAALIISVGPGGQVSSLDSTRVGEKFSSAIRAKARSHAEVAGHNPVIVDAMIDPDQGLSTATNQDGKTIVLRGTPDKHKATDYKTPPTLALERGKLLTLTPNEANKMGVIRGVAKDYAELGELLGKGGWTPASDAGQKLVDEHIKMVTEVTADYDKAVQKIKDAQSMMARAGRDRDTFESSVIAARSAVTKVEKLAKAHEFLAARVAGDFPFGIDRIKLSLDSIIGSLRRR